MPTIKTNTQMILPVINAVLMNVAFILSFLIRYGIPLPDYNFNAYKRSFIYLTLIYTISLSFFRVYKSRFRSSWDLFKRVFLGLFLGTLLSIAFVYIFRAKWGAFPTTVFTLSFFINLLLIFKVNQYILKAGRKIKKKVLVIGQDSIDDIVGKKAVVERIGSDEIGQITKHRDIDL